MGWRRLAKRCAGLFYARLALYLFVRPVFLLLPGFSRACPPREARIFFYVVYQYFRDLYRTDSRQRQRFLLPGAVRRSVFACIFYNSRLVQSQRWRLLRSSSRRLRIWLRRVAAPFPWYTSQSDTAGPVDEQSLVLATCNLCTWGPPCPDLGPTTTTHTLKSRAALVKASSYPRAAAALSFLFPLSRRSLSLLSFCLFSRVSRFCC